MGKLTVLIFVIIIRNGMAINMDNNIAIYRAFQEGGPKAGLIFVVALVTVGGIRTLRMYGVT